MNVRFQVALKYLDWLAEVLQHGPGYVRLSPSHHWNKPFDRKPKAIGGPGLRVGYYLKGKARKRWEGEYLLGRRVMVEPVNPNFLQPFKPYEYRAFDAPLKRTAQALQILENIKAAGGDICTVERREAGHMHCVCILFEGHRPEHLHKCEHGYWP